MAKHYHIEVWDNQSDPSRPEYIEAVTNYKAKAYALHTYITAYFGTSRHGEVKVEFCQDRSCSFSEAFR